MKRSHDQIGKSSTPLGALEFASALNSDDARSILTALKRFYKTVRRERRQALFPIKDDSLDSESDSEDGEHESDDDDDSGNKKARKHEEWTKDTKAYNVPFVGTSVAKGDTGTVIEGTWPCGLLQAYLITSPMAVEMTTSDLVPPSGRVHRKLLRSNKQGRKLSQAIYKAHLKALAELITADVPITTLSRDFGAQQTNSEEKSHTSNQTNESFVSVILRDRLAGIMAMVNEETRQGNRESPLLATALDILSNLAATSLRVAREITRAIDATWKERTLKALLFSPHTSSESNDETGSTRDTNSARTACLRLAVVLMEWQDSAITPYISTRGSRERKVNPGILYLAVRQGVDDPAFHLHHVHLKESDGAYFEVVARLLCALRIMLSNDASRRSLMSKRDLADFFTGEAFVQISQIATCAPPLSKSNSYQRVLSCQDSYPEGTPIEVAGTKSRRILFFFLADSSQSPFITRMNASKTNDKTAASFAQQLVRAMILLLQKSGSLPLQHFLFYCLRTTPLLTPQFFRTLPVPDPKETFAFIARSGFLCRLVREAPLVVTSADSIDEIASKRIDQTVHIVVPANLKKHVLSKALQTANPLVVSEALRLVCALIDRYHSLQVEIKEQHDGEFMVFLQDAFVRRLPDMQQILSLRSRFDPFVAECNAQANTFVIGRFCKVLDAFASNLHDSLATVKYDCAKLLPEEATSFCAVSPILQLQLLNTLEAICFMNEDRPDKQRLSSNAVRLVLEIMMRSMRPLVYRRARSIAIKMICDPKPKSADTEVQNCFDYETSLWVDGLTEECVDELCSLLQSHDRGSLETSIAVVEAWESASFGVPLPPVCFSPLLIAALTTLKRASEGFAFFTCQIAAKCLLFHRHPLPLATLVAHSLEDALTDDVAIANPVDLLRQYCQSLVATTKHDATKQARLLRSLVNELFSRNCVQSSIVGGISDTGDFSLLRISVLEDDAMIAARQCLHMISLSDTEASDAKQIMRVLHYCISLSRKPDTRNDAPFLQLGAIIGHPLILHHHFCWSDVAFINIVAMISSHDRSAESPCIEQMISRTETYAARIARIERQRMTLSPSMLQDILLLSFLNPYLPCETLPLIVQSILRLLCKSIADQKEYLSLCSSLTMYWGRVEKGSISGHSGYIPLDAVFDAWKAIVELDEVDGIFGAVSDHLEVHLSHAFANGSSLGASFLYTLLLEASPSEMIRLCLQSKTLSYQRRGTEVSTHISPLLCRVIACDPDVFGLSLLKCITSTEGEFKYVPLLENGMLDEEIAELVKYKEILVSEYFSRAKDRIVERCCTALLSKVFTEDENDDVEAGLLSLLETTGVLQETDFETFIDRALDLLQSSGAGDMSLHQLLPFSRVLLKCSNNMTVTSQSRKAVGLLSILFLRAIEALHRALKRFFRPRGSGSTFETGQKILATFDLANDLVRRIKIYDNVGVTEAVTQAMTRAIKICLKFGIARSVTGTNDSVPERCLRFIRTMLVEVSDSPSSLCGLKDRCLLLDPSRILAMALAHSEFHVTIIDHKISSSDGALLELVRLLLVCASLSSGKVSFEKDVWTTLLAVYNAGMSELDVTLRRLFHICAEKLPATEVDVTLPPMETLRWKSLNNACIGSSNTKVSGWDWLASWLDISRVRATLCQFPVHDRIVPVPIRNVEVWLNGPYDLTALQTTSGSDDDESASFSDDTSEANLESDLASPFWRPADKYVGQGTDIRYSPAFVLPFVLGALENSLTQGSSSFKPFHGTVLRRNKSLKDDGGGDEEDMPSLQEFVIVSQRLCDKGMLSLTLASLCSECSSLRKVAVAILGFMKRALDSQEARNLSTWRERPQLAMIVDSVQRGLAVTIAMRQDMTVAPSDLQIPKLPAVSAIFLARASLIAAKPGDSMFGQVNRYFLRIDKGHGAFQDTNRLPAFISLFCSSSDEPGQARRERLWALQLLKDSFVDEQCYRMVASCHASELLLTCFGAIATRQEDDQPDMESILLLDTLTTLLQHGGQRAASHLIDRLGLLSWLAATGSALDTLPSVESRIAFVRLIYEGTEKACLYCANEKSSRESLVTESRALVSLVVMLFDDSIDRDLITVQREALATFADRFVAVWCETLRALVLLLTKLNANEEDIRSDGISLASASRILQMVPARFMSMAAWALCTAPLRVDFGVTGSASLFCSSILDLLAAKDADAETRTTLLLRVSLVLSLNRQPLHSDGILDLLLACRSECLASCREAWFECLECIADQTVSSESKTLQMARDMLKANAALLKGVPLK